MASEDAKNVAKEVLETIGKNKKVKLGEIIRKNGYSPKTSLTPKLVTETKSFQETVEPIVNQMIKERQRLMKAIASKSLNKVAYKDSVNSLDTLTKNIQLLSGRATDRTTLILEDQEEIDKALDGILQKSN